MKYFLFILFFFIGFQGFSQNKFVLKQEQDSVQVLYKWKFSKKKKPQLRLAVENTSKTTKELTFVISFYETGITKFVSQKVEVCIVPGTRKRGRAAGLYFTDIEFTQKQIETGEIEWELTEISVKPSTGCK